MGELISVIISEINISQKPQHKNTMLTRILIPVPCRVNNQCASERARPYIFIMFTMNVRVLAILQWNVRRSAAGLSLTVTSSELPLTNCNLEFYVFRKQEQLPMSKLIFHHSQQWDGGTGQRARGDWRSFNTCSQLHTMYKMVSQIKSGNYSCQNLPGKSYYNMFTVWRADWNLFRSSLNLPSSFLSPTEACSVMEGRSNLVVGN